MERLFDHLPAQTGLQENRQTDHRSKETADLNCREYEQKKAFYEKVKDFEKRLINETLLTNTLNYSSQMKDNIATNDEIAIIDDAQCMLVKVHARASGRQFTDAIDVEDSDTEAAEELEGLVSHGVLAREDLNTPVKAKATPDLLEDELISQPPAAGTRLP